MPERPPPLPRPGPQARDVRRLEPDPQLDRPRSSQLDRYFGYCAPYATSHSARDTGQALFEETRNVARALLERVEQLRQGQAEAGTALTAPRKK